MPRFDPSALRTLGAALFEAVGTPATDAELVAGHMVESGLMGHDSHSVLRYPQYVEAARSGRIQCGAAMEVLSDRALTAQVSGHWNFGAVTATKAVQLAIDKVRAGGAISAVTARDCWHVGRLGGFAAMAAEQNLIAILMCNGQGGDLSVVPFGGRERRLPTNPLAVALPTGRDWPIVLDMATSMTSGGAMRVYRNLGQPVPQGLVVDGHGHSTTDVEQYYGPPMGGLLPLGFPGAGHKGFGLSLLVDMLSGALSRGGCSQADPPEPGNALFITLLDIEAFTPISAFHEEVQLFVDWVKSAPPGEGFDEVMFPGEKAHRAYQKRSREGLFVDALAWAQISEVAGELGVPLPTPNN
jgi:uncharacterized oxidoreductase